jgi:hypothetical protein
LRPEHEVAASVYAEQAAAGDAAYGTLSRVERRIGAFFDEHLKSPATRAGT